MRPIVLGTVVALVGVAYSQNGLPSCAQNCVDKFTSGSEIGGCGNLDIACICSSPSFLTGIACCLASACDAADQQVATEYAKQICTTAGVTIPNAVSSLCTSAITTATSSASADSSTGSLVGSSTSSAPVSTTSSSASALASTTKNAGIQNAAGAGMSFAGGLAALFALL